MESLKKIIRKIIARNIDAFLVTSPENRRYLSNFKPDDHSITESSGALLITRNQRFLLTDGRYTEQAKKDSPDWSVITYKKGLVNEIKRISNEIALKTIGFESRYITAYNLNKLKKEIPEISFIPLDGIIEEQRQIKTEPEIEKIKTAIKIAEDVFEESLNFLKPRITEKKLASIITDMLFLRSECPSFPTIVAGGQNSALPHAIPSDREIKEHEPVIIDMGARYDGYCSDMTRTMFINEPDDTLKEIYRTVRDAQKMAIAKIKAGLTGREIDQISRDFIKQKGFGRYFNHSLGHGVGIAVHEAPSFSMRYKKQIKKGMIVTVEPGIYIPGLGGVRLEKMILINDSDCSDLSSSKWMYEF
jgi:Xaa-Pro aminopeptidase